MAVMPALGIDIYDRYQDVWDWRALVNAGVQFVIVKGTDGGGRAVVAADALVRGAQAVGLPVGLYHYAQSTPLPASQADVLAREVHRLAATGLPPCLDFEGTLANSLTGPQGRDWCERFVRRLRELGHRRVMLYANTGHLLKIGVPEWADRDPDLIVWAARYGTNDGRTYPGLGSYSGRVHIHQWTDQGRLPGMSAPVDLNRMLIDALGIAQPIQPVEDDTMRIQLARTAADPTVWAGNGIWRRALTSPEELGNFQWWLAYRFGQPDVDIETIGDIRVLGTPIGSTVNATELAEDVAELLMPAAVAAVERSAADLTDAQLQAIAKAAADESDRRARDSDGATGPVS
jgi:GH25 family lysozyme M1 (1,4-beta-N-acetylmuramidase)